METLQVLIGYLVHIDLYLLSFVGQYGAWTYFFLFLIIFCETGLVIMPFLPGDSLLFAAGSIAAHNSHVLEIKLLFATLMIASILGNKLNFIIGRSIGPRIFKANTSRLFNKNYLRQAHLYYEKHGGKTIIYARFLPIIRTFAPFVAGIAYMNITRFTLYNIISAFIWIGSLLAAGYFLGTLPFIQENFSIVIYSIIAFTIAPPILGMLYKHFKHST